MSDSPSQAVLARGFLSTTLPRPADLAVRGAHPPDCGVTPVLLLLIPGNRQRLQEVPGLFVPQGPVIVSLFKLPALTAPIATTGRGFSIEQAGAHQVRRLSLLSISMTA
jgi:hypothetical protein